MKKAPEVGSRWKMGERTVVYEIVEPAEKRPPREGYVFARMVSQTTDQPIGGRVELAIFSLGTTYKRVKKEGK